MTTKDRTWPISILLAAILSCAVGWDADQSRTDLARYQLHEIGNALSLFLHERGGLPDSLAVLTETQPHGSEARPYLNPKTLEDPWGRQIAYEILGPRDCGIRTYGADGVRGGTGGAADLELMLVDGIPVER